MLLVDLVDLELLLVELVVELVHRDRRVVAAVAEALLEFTTVHLILGLSLLAEAVVAEALHSQVSLDLMVELD